MSSLHGKTLFITGSSRGIGRALALRAARDGANIVIIGKSDRPHATLEGTIHSVAAEVVAAGGRALPLACDVRDENQVVQAALKAAETFGGIDILINNASAIHMAGTPETSAKHYDLMMNINSRGTFICTQACLPYLSRSPRAQILTMSPPLNIRTKWLGASPAYTLSKMGMSLLTMGFAAEFQHIRIAANTLWPKTMIATDAIRVNFPALYQQCRTAEIVADAAHAIFTDPTHPTAQHFIDETVLRAKRITDFAHYALNPTETLAEDIFLD